LLAELIPHFKNGDPNVAKAMRIEENMGNTRVLNHIATNYQDISGALSLDVKV
jgi:hypothetical protein